MVTHDSHYVLYNDDYDYDYNDNNGDSSVAVIPSFLNPYLTLQNDNDNSNNDNYSNNIY